MPTFILSVWDWLGGFAGAAWAALPATKEFWLGIIGTIVGAAVSGTIALRLQMRALRETRAQRREDHLRVQRALAHALFFKVIRIHSDLYGIHRHIEECFEKAAKEKLAGDPWQFVVPLANFAEPVHFSADEMSMLLGLKDMEVFNSIVSLDTVHNGLLDAARVMSAERRALAQQLEADHAEGAKLSGVMDPKKYFALKPKMIEVDSLIEAIRSDAKKVVEDSHIAMLGLQRVLKERLDVALKFESKFKPASISERAEK
jgi:hypothetical protein